MVKWDFKVFLKCFHFFYHQTFRKNSQASLPQASQHAKDPRLLGCSYQQRLALHRVHRLIARHHAGAQSSAVDHRQSLGVSDQNLPAAVAESCGAWLAWFGFRLGWVGLDWLRLVCVGLVGCAVSNLRSLESVGSRSKT